MALGLPCEECRHAIEALQARREAEKQAVSAAEEQVAEKVGGRVMV